MDLLQQVFTDALQRNATETKRWTTYKEDHLKAKANIEEFKKSLEVDIMVPIGSKALMPGKLYHTNEIFVSHSSSMYSKCTSHKAIEICDLRLQLAEQRLIDLTAEQEMYKNKLELPFNEDAFSMNGEQEIIEEYNEEEEEKWRQNHKIKMKQFKKEEAEQRKRDQNAKEDADIMAKLEELELMEELESELEALDIGNDETLEKILSGEVKLPPAKQRISHSLAAEHSDNLTNNNHIPNNHDFHENSETESQSSYDEEGVPPEFRLLEREILKKSNAEKFKFYKKHLAEVQHYLENVKPKSVEEFNEKTDKIFFSEYLLDALEKIRDDVNFERFIDRHDTADVDDDNIIDDLDEIIQNNDPDVLSRLDHAVEKLPISILNHNKTKTKKPKRSIRFATEDDVLSFCREEKPSQISTDKLTNRLSDINRNLPAIDEHKLTTRDDGPTLSHKFNHSVQEFLPTDDDENDHLIGSPADIYVHYAHCMKLSDDQLRDKNKMRDYVKNMANLNLDHMNNVISSVVSNSPKQDKLPSKLPEKSIRQEEPIAVIPSQLKSLNDTVNNNNKKTTPILSDKKLNEDDAATVEKCRIELNEQLDFIVKQSSVAQNEPDPLPEGNFVDAVAPKKRIRFKASRQK